uniref:Uncharacterized protein n=1 Tax=Escherichia coli TaxID=562 RepID=A0A2S1JCW5_ECOLX|nr:hypothetical protein [Escherichia coli]
MEHNQQLTKNTEGIQIFSGDHICQSDCKTLFTKSGVYGALDKGRRHGP